MAVLTWLLVAPLGLLVILGLAWFEDRMLRPPASPAEQVLRRQIESGPQNRSTPVAQLTQGGAELLSLVRNQPRQITGSINPPSVQGRDSAA
ncbi:hypothetical protein [Streptacidiphilus albus]|uniref:hypothetical protein n=1 Tax=Streptacidiphilus albus TaxID=105425 RepID=UPI00054BCA40|nr:hypothetical protein [Streptacidiphilus albus]